MDWSISSIVGIGLRLLSNRNEIARVARKAGEVFGEARDVISKVAPGLLVDMGIRETTPTALEPHAFDVKWVQEALNHLMHPDVKLKVDGVMGERTREAIHKYQTKRKLTADGWLGPLTLAALEEDIQQAHAGASRS